jgi:CHAT domain
MTPRTVVSVGVNGEEELTVELRLAPVAYPKAQVPLPLGYSSSAMPAWTTPRAVEAHGRELLKKLSNHPAIGLALADLMRAPLTQKRTLYFHIKPDTDEGELLWWEALCGAQDDQFLSLDARWPIARMAESGIDQQLCVPTFTPPLKVLVLLSALGRDAIPEWRRFYEAVESARKDGLPVSVTALIGQPDLFQALTADIAAGTVTGVTAQPIPDRLPDLAAVINSVGPHVVHFFCHGAANSGTARLELGVFADFARNDGKSQVVLAVETLMGFPGMQSTWLVTLNCCEGGKAVERLHSMAYRLVAAGVPTAVGMLEPVDVSDAYEFCGYFYSAAFTAIREAFAAARNNGAAEVQWADALFPPRAALGQTYRPADDRQWLRPVLYVRPEPFQIQAPSAAPATPPPSAEALAAMKQRAETVAGALRAMPPDTPADVRQGVLGLLADLPPTMRPDAFGNFSTGG